MTTENAKAALRGMTKSAPRDESIVFRLTAWYRVVFLDKRDPLLEVKLDKEMRRLPPGFE